MKSATEQFPVVKNMIKVGENGERTVISMDEFLKEKIMVRRFDVNRKLWLLPDGEEGKDNLDDFERELKRLSDEIEAQKEKDKRKRKTSKRKIR